MFTLCIRYTLDPNKIADFRAYAEAEQEPIRRSSGTPSQYFLPTDFAGPTNEALGLIDFATLASYEQYRRTLAEDPDIQKNIAELVCSGVVVSVNRSFIRRLGDGP